MFAKYLQGTTALVALSLVAFPAASFAQDAAPADPAASNDDAVVIVGTRASQRSSIDRKKRAKTATDSIVAEDVGKFPDANIGEAISRIAGVALNRGDFNEGTDVTVRGNSSDVTNVEIDGLGVLENSTTGGLWAGGSGRSKDFREFPADMIKSVDVVKGSTAAMTEGGLGGSIVIKTRTGLDFKKPYVSLSLRNTMSSINERQTPSINFVGARKFMNDRLGILVNYSQSRVINDNHATENATSRNAGQFRLIDFDNSPNKTFSFDQDLVRHATANNVIADSTAFTAGPFAGQAKTASTIVGASEAAQTKADCYAWFQPIDGNNNASARRTQELQTCLNQWNDYTPSLTRYIIRRDDEQRQALDLRADYRVSDNLTVFGKFAYSRRNVANHQLTYDLGTVNINPTTVTTPSYNGRTFSDTTTFPRQRSAVAGSGYYLYDGVSQGTVLSNATNTVEGNRYVRGIVANIVPGSVVVDSAHHLTSFDITDGRASINQIQNTNDWKTKTLSFGGNYHGDKLNIDFIAGRSETEYSRYDRRMGLGYTYGAATFNIDPTSGLWTITPKSDVDLYNASNYVIMAAQTTGQTAVPAGGTVANGTSNGLNPNAVPAYTAAQRPWVSPSIEMQYSPKLQNSNETTIRLDADYDVEDRLPFFTKVYAGFNAREFEQRSWGGGSLTVSPAVNRNPTTGAAIPYGQPGYVNPVVVPDSTFRGQIRACDNTRYGAAGTAAPAGAQSCDYGFVPFNDLANRQEGVYTVTQADLTNMIGQVLGDPWDTFYNSYPDRGNLLEGWPTIDVEKFYSLVSESSKDAKYSAGGDPLGKYNFDCLKVCTGSDGKEYNMPFSYAKERTIAAYYMVDFEVNLPWTMRFDGNGGYRYVRTDVEGNGFMTFTAIKKTSAFNAADPNAVAGIASASITKQVTMQSTTEDWTPSLNLNLWGFNDQVVARYNWGEVVARPPLNRLLPSGTCTYDQRDVDNGTTNDCGTVGNPGLLPLESLNQNYSVEYYPNRDTMFSLAYFKNKIIRGGPISRNFTGKVLEGTGAVDPITGASLEDIEFVYPTWVNSAGLTRKGIEASTKMAFTFLPWKFKYLGFDGNYAKIESSLTADGWYDLLTGAPLPPQNEPSYYYNASLWYDDGTTTARLAIQGRDRVFNDISAANANTVNNYPNPAEGRITVLPYNPGSPMFTEKTTYIDFKITHNVTKELELFFEMRNANNELVLQTQGEFAQFADGTPSVLNNSWPGYRVTYGITFRR
ncbi:MULTISPECIES: TonB-dependent receptor [Asticcacaulis]|uniref:TonB-dependent receptor n=1 Tax=Asticcacaulis TaxID=76890 RepID=UPI001AE3CEA3|nr:MULTISPECIES: TonB-dependent receptor [Asticcacaulis]MBP2160806.1 TonB-dependent receptor [Asticcacaulis solisilvae]MDR6801990.1 TonB-dependent receptor [Asticcacaulis sp. BE141]